MGLDPLSIVTRFKIYGDVAAAVPYGNGHVNDTYAVTVRQAGRPVRYLLQRINSRVFRAPAELMDNIRRVCSETTARLEAEGADDVSRRTLTTVLSEEDGRPYCLDDEGHYWRMYLFIEGAIGYDVVATPMQAYEASYAFGAFQRRLADLPGSRLHETIEGFHDTPRRFQTFLDAVAVDPMGRRESVENEVAFFASYADRVSQLVDLGRSGELPERITHNDTKLNNVLIDERTDKATCVIDLDTVMPGLAPYDFGDLVRTSTVRTAEDERTVERVHLDIELFRAVASGYIDATRRFLLPAEREHLLVGARLMIFEVGVRFLTDYLTGDRYFKTKYPDHNAIRCRTQMKLLQSLEGHWSRLIEIVEACAESPGA